MEDEYVRERIASAVTAVRTETPLVGSITNTVTMNFVANAQLAVGGSAAMVYLPDEGEALAKAGSAMYINVGTLLPVYEDTVPRTAGTLHDLSKPWVLDPVAIGIGDLRTRLLQECKPYKPSIIRGNASEIIALAGLWELDDSAVSTVRGVDTTDTVRDAMSGAVALATWTGGAVAVSGACDFITDGVHQAFSYGGSPLMTRVTGCGCSLGGVMAVYAAVASPFIAALTGAAMYNIAGKKAAADCVGPGSFSRSFLDYLYTTTAQEVCSNPFTVEEV